MPFARGATAFGPPPSPWGQRDKEYMGQLTIGQWTMRQWTMGHWGNIIRRAGQGDNAQWDFVNLAIKLAASLSEATTSGCFGSVLLLRTFHV
jgi:hypothetical protein